jgi:hypothetical protein
LLRDSAHVQWWVATLGFGWAAALTCLATGAVPSCAVTSVAGAHAGSVEELLLREGSLVSSPQLRAVFDTGEPYARDLNHDGELDVIGLDSDYTPNYASGHNYWVTYRFQSDSLVETGCALRVTQTQPPPDHLLTGRCPARPGGLD